MCNWLRIDALMANTEEMMHEYYEKSKEDHYIENNTNEKVTVTLVVGATKVGTDPKPAVHNFVLYVIN